MNNIVAPAWFRSEADPYLRQVDFWELFMSDIGADLRSMLENLRFERTGEYVRKGRRFAGEELSELRKGWVKSFKQWAAGFDDPAARYDYDDRESELDLRGEKAPYDEVADEMQALDRKARAAMAAAREDSVLWAALKARVHQECGGFVEQAAAGKKSAN